MRGVLSVRLAETSVPGAALWPLRGTYEPMYGV